MNFSSHQKQLIQKIEEALEKPKKSLVSDFVFILDKARNLYKTNTYDFWLDMIKEADLHELPITIYGHSEAVREVESLTGSNMHSVKSGIDDICENLFTYSNCEDFCEMQSQFHFYFSVTHNTIYKVSELGVTQGIDVNEIGKSRIAFTSEINASSNEFYV